MLRVKIRAKHQMGWVTTQASGVFSDNERRLKFKEMASSICPICKQAEVIETARHQLVCGDATRTHI